MKRNLLFAAPENETAGLFSISVSGFIKSDYWVDSRSVIASRDDLFFRIYAARIYAKYAFAVDWRIR